MRKPMEQVFSEFAGRKPVKEMQGDTYMGSGDVKYHLGTSYDRPTISGARARQDSAATEALPLLQTTPCAVLCCKACLGASGALPTGFCA